MGIKHFWIWFKQNFREDINTVNLSSHSAGISVDTLAIDMNGIYHVCAQKVYKYGNYAPKFKKPIHKNSRSKQHALFKAIAEEIDFYRRLVNPKKKLLLCILYHNKNINLNKLLEKIQLDLVDQVLIINDGVDYFFKKDGYKKIKFINQAKKDFELTILQEEQKVRIEEQRIRAIRDICVSYNQQQINPDLSWLK